MVRFRIQDPTDPDGRVLFDELVQALGDPTVMHWSALYAFASEKAAIAVLEHPAFEEFKRRRGVARLLVGIDAVTNASALERLRDLQGEHLIVEVFRSLMPGTLFHPKVSIFRGSTDRLIVGSGNFTHGGLNRNYEAYASYSAGADQGDGWLAEIDAFRARNIDSIREIDEDALERARLNSALTRQARAAARASIATKPLVVVETDDDTLVVQTSNGLGGSRRVLVAEVPKARWGQVQFDMATASTFFGLQPGLDVEVQLEGVDEHGAGQALEGRRLVFSEVNANSKLEFSTRRDRQYPAEGDGRPVLVVREDAPRSYAYSLFMPGDSEYDDIAGLARTADPHFGIHRLITTWDSAVRDAPGAAARIADLLP